MDRVTTAGDARFPLVLAAPSGGGKTTVRKALLERRRDLRFSVSATTRDPRPGEREGVDYSYLSRDRFEDAIEAGEFLEWAEVHGELYGTPMENLRRARADGVHLVLDVDVQGTRQIRRSEPDAVTVFILPPSLDLLIDRLRRRGSEDGEELRRRLETARAELAALSEFDYAVVNDVLAETVRAIEAIIAAEGCRIRRQDPALSERVATLRETLRLKLDAVASGLEKARS